MRKRMVSEGNGVDEKKEEKYRYSTYKKNCRKVWNRKKIKNKYAF